MVYSTIFFVYSSSTGWLASWPGFSNMFALGCEKSGSVTNAAIRHRRSCMERIYRKMRLQDVPVQREGLSFEAPARFRRHDH